MGYLHDTILIVVFLRLPVRHWREHTEGIESNVRNTDCEVEYPGLILTPDRAIQAQCCYVYKNF